MKIVLTGGGTGGHITPAISIYESMKEKHPETEFLFIGRKGGNENQPVISEGIPLMEIEVFGLQRKLTFKNIKNVTVAILAYIKAKKTLKKYHPDCVVGTGGYVCWPTLKAAQNLKIPTFLHESNAFPGLATRLLEKNCNILVFFAQQPK